MEKVKKICGHQSVLSAIPEEVGIILQALLKDDIEEGDLNRPEMTAKLICTLETAMHRAMQEKQYSAVATNAKGLMKLIGLEAKIKS